MHLFVPIPYEQPSVCTGRNLVGQDRAGLGQGRVRAVQGTGFFVHQRTASAVKRVEFVSDRLSYIVLRGRWCNIIVLNAHAPSEEKSDEEKDSFYEELEQVFDHFPKYHMKIVLEDFNAEVRRENIID